MAYFSTSEFIILFTLFVPLFGAFLASVTRDARYRDINTLIISFALFINVINLFSLTHRGMTSDVHLFEILPGMDIHFSIEPLGIIFALIASFLWFVTSIYSIGYMRSNNEAHQNRFYSFFAIAIFAAHGVAFAGNLLTLFIFYEILTLSTLPLVTHHGNERACKGGRTYLSLLLTTSIIFFLPAIIWVHTITGTTEFMAGGILSTHTNILTIGALLFLFAFGIGKAALMPFHRWLPAAMVAPTPVSALLHAVAVVKAGVFCIIKIVVYIFGVDHLATMIDINWWSGGWLLYISGITIILASCMALKQDNLKARLAYSTISQLSYVILATAILAPISIAAASFHIAAHAFGKITLFFAAGSIYTASKKTLVSQLDGIGKIMPWTMAAFTIGSLSMIGIPPAVGFLTKYYMLVGAFERELIFAVIVIILSTLLNAAYFLPIVHAAYFKPLAGSRHSEAPKMILIALAITASMTLILFFYPNHVLWLSSLVAGM